MFEIKQALGAKAAKIMDPAFSPCVLPYKSYEAINMLENLCTHRVELEILHVITGNIRHEKHTRFFQKYSTKGTIILCFNFRIRIENLGLSGNSFQSHIPYAM